MISSALILSILLPIQIAQADPRFSAFAVKAAIDTAVIIGIPSSRAAKDYARRVQAPDFVLAAADQAIKPVGWRRLYFRKLFVHTTVRFNK
jgi:hypothetical protein